MIDTTINTKLVAMLSKHISMDDFEDFATILSVPELASYLKEIPRYRRLLGDINVEQIHREALENKIKLIKTYETKKLRRYHAKRFKLLEKELEIDELLILLQSLRTDADYHYQVPWIQNLSKKHEADIYEALEASEYKDLLIYRDDLLKLEINLKSYLINYAIKHYQKESPALVETFKKECELFVLSYIYRYKKYFNANEKDIHTLFDPLLEDLDLNSMMDWINHGKSKDLYQLLKLDDSKDIPLERLIYKNLKRIYLKNMRYSEDTYLLMFSYMRLVDIEIKNLTDIIEGVRYKIGTEKIMDLLIMEEV